MLIRACSQRGQAVNRGFIPSEQGESNQEPSGSTAQASLQRHPSSTKEAPCSVDEYGVRLISANRDPEVDQGLRDPGKIVAIRGELEDALALGETCQDRVPQSNRLAAWKVQGNSELTTEGIHVLHFALRATLLNER
jgi:hypothetical protein